MSQSISYANFFSMLRPRNQVSSSPVLSLKINKMQCTSWKSRILVSTSLTYWACGKPLRQSIVGMFSILSSLDGWTHHIFRRFLITQPSTEAVMRHVRMLHGQWREERTFPAPQVSPLVVCSFLSIWSLCRSCHRSPPPPPPPPSSPR